MTLKRPRCESAGAATDNVHVQKIKPLIPPACLEEEIPITEPIQTLVETTRSAISDILHNKDDRLVCIVGPCSIHDPDAALEYAAMLLKLKEELKNDLLLVMRVYFEKPRTTIGWKGLINDPDLNGSYQINKGLRTARTLLKNVNEMGLPCAVEFLDVISPQYIADLVCWGAIGARTTESQVHRELASGLSSPIGFKNGTTGNVQIAVDAIRSSAEPHRFLGVTKQGLAGIVFTNGNPDGHVVLRGGSEIGPNYELEHVQAVRDQLKKVNIDTKIVVDCSHGNSKKVHTNQPLVCADIANQVRQGGSAIGGIMVESNLVAGAQKLDVDKPEAKLVRGQSVTDACVDMAATADMLRNLAKAVADSRKQ